MLSILSFLLPIPHSCVTPSLAVRNGKENCWVQFEIDQKHRLCLSYSLWQEWLKTSPPNPICQDPSTNWTPSAALTNSLHALAKEIHHTQYLRKFTDPLPVPIQVRWLYIILQKTERVRERTSELLIPSDHTGIARSLILRQKISNSSLGIFRRIGFVHLVSASGIHLYVIVQNWNVFVRTVFSLLKVPLTVGLWFNRVTTFAFCLAIWLLNGASLGMLRPWAIILFRQLAGFLGFRWKKASPLFLAILIDCIISLIRNFHGLRTETGKWGYALAVGGGLFWWENFKFPHWGLAIGSWAGVAIWEIWESGFISIATPLLSFVTLPFVCLLFYPLILLCVALNEVDLHSFAIFLSQILLKTLHIFLSPLTRLALGPWNIWIISKEAFIVASILSAFLLIFLHSPRKKLQVFFLALLLSLTYRLFRTFPVPRQSSALVTHVEQLDIGQGDAAIVEGTQIGFIDTGSEHAISLGQWLELLLERRIEKISWIGLTHLDEDHSGGSSHLAKLVPIQCIVTPRAELTGIKGKNFSLRLKNFGLQVKNWNDNCIPYPHFAIEKKAETHSRQTRNENMGVIWIPLKTAGYYLSAGDAHASAEKQIIKWVTQLPEWKSLNPKGHRILKVSHHGSKSSNESFFLHHLQPTEAWISVGNPNRYGHPAIQTLERLNQNGIYIKRTDRDGALSIRVAGPHPRQKRLP